MRLVESVVEALTFRVEATGVVKLAAICQVDVLEWRYHESWDSDKHTTLFEFVRIDFYIVHESG